MHRRHYLAVFVITAVIASACYILLKQASKPLGYAYVAESMQRCVTHGASSQSIIACSRQSIRNLLSTHSTRELMENMATGTIPAIFYSCHQVGHIIGAETYRKTGDLEKTLAQCTYGCSNSCIHGALASAVDDELGPSDEDLAHANIDEIEKIGKKYCSYVGLCHGIGHLFFLNSGDFIRSLKACDSISTGIYAEQCYQGVFMQGVGGFSASLIVGDSLPPPAEIPDANYTYPCDMVDVGHRHACFQFLAGYQNILFEKNGISDLKDKFATAIRACSKLDGRTRSECFEGVGRVSWEATFGSRSNVCTFAPLAEEDRESCVLGKVNIMTQFDRYKGAESFCAGLPASSAQTTCYRALFQYYRDTRPRSHPSAICAEAADPEPCLMRLEEFFKIEKNLPNYRFGLHGEVQK